MGHRVVYAPQSEIVHLVSRTEGRFDREDLNREKFKARWSDKVVPDEREFLREAGFYPGGATKSTRASPLPPGEGVATADWLARRVRDPTSRRVPHPVFRATFSPIVLRP
jgi:hypothetical protein